MAIPSSSLSLQLCSSKKKEEKDMMCYFCVPNYYSDEKDSERKYCYDWYRFDPSKTAEFPTEQLQQFTRMITPTRRGYTESVKGVVLNSILYVFQSYRYKSHQNVRVRTYVSTFNLVSNHWIHNFLNIKLKRMSPEVFVLGGKIFVLGCKHTPDNLLEHWGMVFDPILNEWTSLPAPPVPPLKTRLKLASSAPKVASCAVIDEKQFIVSLKFASQFFVFDIQSWNWSFIQLPRPLIRMDFNTKMLVVSRMLYVFDYRKIYTYDLDQKEGSTDTMMIEVNGFYTPSCAGPINPPFFPFHRGDNSFCFVFSPMMHYKAIDAISVIHCLKFRVNPTINYHGKQVFEANIESCESYTANGGVLKGCVAVESAKTNLNVEEVFFSIARDIKQRLAETDARAEV